MTDEILVKIDAMYKAMVADRDAWEANACKCYEALGGIIDLAENYLEYYREMWGEYRKENQNGMAQNISKARAALQEDTP